MHRQVRPNVTQNGRKRGNGRGQAWPLGEGRPLRPLTQGWDAHVRSGKCLRSDASWKKSKQDLPPSTLGLIKLTPQAQGLGWGDFFHLLQLLYNGENFLKKIIGKKIMDRFLDVLEDVCRCAVWKIRNKPSKCRMIRDGHLQVGCLHLGFSPPFLKSFWKLF